MNWTDRIASGAAGTAGAPDAHRRPLARGTGGRRRRRAVRRLPAAPRAGPRPAAPCSWAPGWRRLLQGAAAANSAPASGPRPPQPSPQGRQALPTQSGAGGRRGEDRLVPRAVSRPLQGEVNRNGALTAHLLLKPIFEHGHTCVDPGLPWLSASIPPGGDSVQDLPGVGARLRTGQGASRITLRDRSQKRGYYIDLPLSFASLTLGRVRQL